MIAIRPHQQQIDAVAPYEEAQAEGAREGLTNEFVQHDEAVFHFKNAQPGSIQEGYTSGLTQYDAYLNTPQNKKYQHYDQQQPNNVPPLNVEYAQASSRSKEAESTINIIQHEDLSSGIYSLANRNDMQGDRVASDGAVYDTALS